MEWKTCGSERSDVRVPSRKCRGVVVLTNAVEEQKVYVNAQKIVCDDVVVVEL